MTGFSHSRRTTVALTVLLTLALTVTAVSPAAAADDSDEDLDRLEKVEAFVQTMYDAAMGSAGGLYERAKYESAAFNPFGDPPDLENESVQTMQLINDNEQAILDYANNQTDPSDYDQDNFRTHQVTLSNERYDLEETFYIEAEYNETTGQWTSLEAINETDREVDQQHNASEFFATKLSEETEYFLDHYVTTGESPGANYLGRMGTQYGGLLGSHFESTAVESFSALEYLAGGDE